MTWLNRNQVSYFCSIDRIRIELTFPSVIDLYVLTGRCNNYDCAKCILQSSKRSRKLSAHFRQPRIISASHILNVHTLGVIIGKIRRSHFSSIDIFKPQICWATTTSFSFRHYRFTASKHLTRSDKKQLQREHYFKTRCVRFERHNIGNIDWVLFKRFE